MLAAIRDIYRSSKKKKDINWFTEWVCRPPAAVVVYALRNTRVTPNQVTFASFVACAISCFIIAFGDPWWMLLLGVGIFEFSFILDCADGQLARLRKTSSALGHQLDFLMDEIKAMMVMVAVALRVLITDGVVAPSSLPRETYLYLGLFGLLGVSGGIAMTTFVRREEFGAKPPTEDGQPAEIKRGKSPLGLVLFALEYVARLFVHYPQYIWLAAVTDKMHWFLWAFACVHALYFLRVFAQIFLRLGRFDPRETP